MQELKSNHTTNLIDAKIGLQIALIEVYFSGFFFDMRLEFKGRFRSILAIICDQYCLNMIAIESSDGYYVAYKPITLSCIFSMFIEMKFIHCHSCLMFAMKSMKVYMNHHVIFPLLR